MKIRIVSSLVFGLILTTGASFAQTYTVVKRASGLAGSGGVSPADGYPLTSTSLKRMSGLAGAGGSGSVQVSPQTVSVSYRGRMVSYLSRFFDVSTDFTENPVTEVEIRAATDGSILSRRVLKTSGNKLWDAVVLNAIDKAMKLPLSETGWMPPTINLSIGPRDRTN